MSSTDHIVGTNRAMINLAEQLEATAAQMEADAAAKRYEANRLRAMADDGFKAPLHKQEVTDTFDADKMPGFLRNGPVSAKVHPSFLSAVSAA
jgi:hypothetical protein